MTLEARPDADALRDQDEAIVSRAREIASEVAALHADAVDREARFPSEAVAALREAGLLAALIPTELGGLGGTLSAVARASEELARGCSATAMVFAMHQIQVATIMRHCGTQEWFTAYLAQVAAAQRLIASVTSEIGTGGDLGRSIAAVTAAEDGTLRFEKAAPTVSYGAYADDLLTTVRRAPDADETDQVLVLHHARQTELKPAGTWDTIGMRGTCSPGFAVSAIFAPDQVLNSPFATVMFESIVPISHILWSHVWLGIATDAFDRGRASVRAAARRSPGQPVPAATALSRVMADLTLLRGEVRSGLEAFLAADAEPDRGSLGTMRTMLRFNNLKLAASEQAPRVCSGVLEVVGIAAYKNDSPYGVGRHLRDALSARLMVANERIHAIDAGLLLLAKDA